LIWRSLEYFSGSAHDEASVGRRGGRWIQVLFFWVGRCRRTFNERLARVNRRSGTASD